MTHKMTTYLQNGTSKASEGASVLKGETPNEVARAMIEGGQKETFYLFDMDEAYRRIKHFQEVMPRVQIFYAMKANDWDLMLKLVISQGLGFDCASPGEISKALKLGVSPTSIIFALPTKTEEQMVYARDAGVKHTTFDSSHELVKIKQSWPDANLLIRIRVDGDSIYKLGDKFGCDFDTEAKALLDEAAALGLKVVGVAFHVGSGCISIDSHVLGLQRARTLFDYEAQAGRRNMNIVDIGGGFLSDTTEGIDQTAKLINQALDEFFPDPRVQVIAEPGRYICDSSADLYTSVSNNRKIIKDNKPVNMIYINDGLHGTLRYMEFWHTAEKFNLGNQKNGLKNEELHETILWGPTCDSTDRVLGDRQVFLPACSPLDWLVFRTKGAYSYGYQGPFSSIEIPRMRALISEELWNKIKGSPVFSPSDFVLNPDLHVPLPTTLPPVPTTIMNPALKNNALKVI